MNKYLLLFCGGSMPDDPAMREQAMQSWGEWFKQLGNNLADQGNPFTDNTKTLVPSTGGHDDHPHNASGYCILQASSMEEAEKLAQDCPVLQAGASITIYETYTM